MEYGNSVPEKTAESGFERLENMEQAPGMAQEPYENANLMGQAALGNIEEETLAQMPATETEMNPNLVDGQLVGTDLPKNVGDGEKMRKEYIEIVDRTVARDGGDLNKLNTDMAELGWEYRKVQFNRDKYAGLYGDGGGK